MAKQNFLAGGFYGKLGATVGQRWKNQRTIRTYVIPENPRTPKQMANRNKFTAAVPFAQKGMSMNYRSPAFASETTTEWALRMSSAKYAIDLGQSDVAAIPVVPRGFTSTYTVTGIAVESVTDATHAKLLLTGDLPAGAKHYSLMIYFSDGSRVGEYMLCHGETTAADTTDLTITCEDTTDLLTATLYGVIVSNDDIDAQTVTYSARIAIEKAAKPAFTTDWVFVSITKLDAMNYRVRMHMTEGIAGFTGVRASYIRGNQGTWTTKQNTLLNGGESGAPTSAISNDDFRLDFYQFDEATNDALLTLTFRRTSDLQCYNNAKLGIEFQWSNAYTPNTEMSSGRSSVVYFDLPQYLQDELNIELETTPPYVMVQEQVDDEYTYGAIEYWLKDAISIAAWNAHHPSTGKLQLVSGNSNLNLIAGGRTYIGVIDWHDTEDDWGSDGDFNWGLGTIDVTGLTGDNITGGTTNAFVVRMCLEENLNKRIGTYDINHRWTPIPDWSIPAGSQIGTY